MKERSKERIATLMMEELLEQLAGREAIKKMLADMTSGVPVDEVIEKLLDEFEQLVERHHREIIESRPEPLDPLGEETLLKACYRNIGPDAAKTGGDLYMMVSGALSHGTTSNGLHG